MRSCENHIYFNTQAGQLKSTKTPLTYIDIPVHAHTRARTNTHVLHGITSRDIYILSIEYEIMYTLTKCIIIMVLEFEITFFNF